LGVRKNATRQKLNLRGGEGSSPQRPAKGKAKRGSTSGKGAGGYEEIPKRGFRAKRKRKRSEKIWPQEWGKNVSKRRGVGKSLRAVGSRTTKLGAGRG